MVPRTESFGCGSKPTDDEDEDEGEDEDSGSESTGDEDEDESESDLQGDEDSIRTVLLAPILEGDEDSHPFYPY